MAPGGCVEDLWYRFMQAGAAQSGGRIEDQPDAPMLLSDRGRGLGFVVSSPVSTAAEAPKRSR